MWGKVSCLKKQHDDRDWGQNHSDLKSKALSTTPLHGGGWGREKREWVVQRSWEKRG